MQYNEEAKVAGKFGSNVQFLTGGSAGTVFTVRTSTKHNLSIAVKVIPKSENAPFQGEKMEVDILRKCQFAPFVVSVLHWTETTEYFAFSQEFCEMGDLFEYLQSNSLTVRSLQVCMAQIGMALQHIHHNIGVIHEDIKPENIGITRSGNIKLLDFGCAVQAAPEGVTCSKGTIHYASPEKLQRIPHGFEADWWSYGVLLFELVYGCLPFVADTQEETASTICTASIEEILAQVDEGENQGFANGLIKQLLCKSFDKRFSMNGFDEIMKDELFYGLNFANVLHGKISVFPVYEHESVS